MAQGGYRPGAGRPRLTEEEKARRAELRKAGLLPPGRITKKMAERQAAARIEKVKGAKPAKKAAPKKTAPVKAATPAVLADPPEVPGEVVAEAAAFDMDPLTYMLTVMRDREADPIRRDRMAIAAAPFVHPRKEPVGQGKKEAVADAAKAAASKFRPVQAPPLKLVNGQS